MASKDEYFKRIIASLQSDISSQNKAICNLNSTLARQQKEIEALKASPKPQQSPSQAILTAADKSNLLQQAKRECDGMIQTRFNLLSSRYVEKRELDTFRTTVVKTYLPTDTFTTYKKTLETRLKSIEDKLSRRFKLFSINRHKHKFYSTYKSPFNINDVIQFFKNHKPQWLLRILVCLFIFSLAVYLFSTINT